MEEAIIESIMELLPESFTNEEKLGSINKIIDLLEKEMNSLIQVDPTQVFVIEDLTRSKLLENDFITGVSSAQELKLIAIKGVDQKGKFQIYRMKSRVDSEVMLKGRLGEKVPGNWYMFPGDINLSALIIACDKIPVMKIEV